MAINISRQNQAYVNKRDLFLLSYPRSGNTWLRQMLIDVYFQELGYDTQSPQFLINHFFTASPSFENHDLSQYTRPDHGFFLLKAHDPWVAECFRYVYVYREPEDAIVSYRRFLKKAPVTYMEDGLEEFCRKETTAWCKHAEKAIENADRALFVSYSGMMQNTQALLRKICTFAGLHPSDEQLASAISHNTSAVQRQRYIAVGGEALADYSIATGRVGGNVEFLSSETLNHIRTKTSINFRSLEALSLSIAPD